VRIEVLEISGGAVVRMYNVGEETFVIWRYVVRRIYIHDSIDSQTDIPVKPVGEIFEPEAMKANVTES